MLNLNFNCLTGLGSLIGFWCHLCFDHTSFFFHFQQDGPTQIPEIPEDAIYPEEDLFDVESLLDDDTFMSIAFE